MFSDSPFQADVPGADENGEGSNHVDESSEEISHPIEATAWETEVFLLTHNLPPSDSVQNCRSQVENAAREVESENALIGARDEIKVQVQDDPKLFHYCFYILTHKLSQDLSGSSGNLREKALLFLGKIQELWILARALDQLNGSSVYFNYLQRRYIQISLSVFGRQLSVIGRSLDQLPRPEWQRNKSIIQGGSNPEDSFGSGVRETQNNSDENSDENTPENSAEES